MALCFAVACAPVDLECRQDVVIASERKSEHSNAELVEGIQMVQRRLLIIDWVDCADVADIDVEAIGNRLEVNAGVDKVARARDVFEHAEFVGGRVLGGGDNSCLGSTCEQQGSRGDGGQGSLDGRHRDKEWLAVLVGDGELLAVSVGDRELLAVLVDDTELLC